jgi:hypothetical protein
MKSNVYFKVFSIPIGSYIKNIIFNVGQMVGPAQIKPLGKIKVTP